MRAGWFSLETTAVAHHREQALICLHSLKEPDSAHFSYTASLEAAGIVQ